MKKTHIDERLITDELKTREKLLKVIEEHQNCVNYVDNKIAEIGAQIKKGETTTGNDITDYCIVNFGIDFEKAKDNIYKINEKLKDSKKGDYVLVVEYGFVHIPPPRSDYGSPGNPRNNSSLSPEEIAAFNKLKNNEKSYHPRLTLGKLDGQELILSPEIHSPNIKLPTSCYICFNPAFGDISLKNASNIKGNIGLYSHEILELNKPVVEGSKKIALEVIVGQDAEKYLKKVYNAHRYQIILNKINK